MSDPIVLPKALESRLATAAAKAHASPQELARQAIAAHLDLLEWREKAIRAGFESGDTEGWRTTEQVFAAVAAQRSRRAGNQARAGRDLLVIEAFYAEYSQVTAKRAMAEIRRNALLRETHPQIGRRGHVSGTRELVIIKWSAIGVSGVPLRSGSHLQQGTFCLICDKGEPAREMLG